MGEENETLRWPTNLDREAIVKRLVKVREAAEKAGLAQLAALYAGIEELPASKIGAKVIAGMNLVQEDPAQQPIAQQLAMVAMNLKNLKG